jgi:hypothetical protein
LTAVPSSVTPLYAPESRFALTDLITLLLNRFESARPAKPMITIDVAQSSTTTAPMGRLVLAVVSMIVSPWNSLAGRSYAGTLIKRSSGSKHAHTHARQGN